MHLATGGGDAGLAHHAQPAADTQVHDGPFGPAQAPQRGRYAEGWCGVLHDGDEVAPRGVIGENAVAVGLISHSRRAHRRGKSILGGQVYLGIPGGSDGQ